MEWGYKIPDTRGGNEQMTEDSGSPNIFISWSGDRSYQVAEALRDWLRVVLQTTRPWVSGRDIEKGARWFEEVSKALNSSKIGVLCLTAENQDEPWLLFEAGALSNKLPEKTRLCTYLFGGLGPEDVRPPLSMFQGTKADRDDTRELLHSINRALGGSPVPDEGLNKLFDRMWPELEERLGQVPAEASPPVPKRPIDDMVAEILEIVRSLSASGADEQARLFWEQRANILPVSNAFGPDFSSLYASSPYGARYTGYAPHPDRAAPFENLMRALKNASELTSTSPEETRATPEEPKPSAATARAEDQTSEETSERSKPHSGR
jgi:hypothetical protein